MDNTADAKKSLAKALDECSKRFASSTERGSGARAEVVRRASATPTEVKRESGDAK